MKAADLAGPALAIAGALAVVASLAIGRSAHGAEGRARVEDLPVWRILVCDPPAPFGKDCLPIEAPARLDREACRAYALAVVVPLVSPPMQVACAVDARALAAARGL